MNHYDRFIDEKQVLRISIGKKILIIKIEYISGFVGLEIFRILIKIIGLPEVSDR